MLIFFIGIESFAYFHPLELAIGVLSEHDGLGVSSIRHIHFVVVYDGDEGTAADSSSFGEAPVKGCFGDAGPLIFNPLVSIFDGLYDLLVTFGPRFLELLVYVEVHLFHGELGDLPSTVAVENTLVISVQVR